MGYGAPDLSERIAALRRRLWMLGEMLEAENDLIVSGEIADQMMACAARICELRRRVRAEMAA